MRKLSRLLVALALAATYACVMAAQEMTSGNASIPKVLQISREFVKPGKQEWLTTRQRERSSMRWRVRSGLRTISL